MLFRSWLSEIMLQQTRVEAVRGYYARFLAALPDMPVTERMEDVGIFIRSNKPESYFMDQK